jgi:hypothetical protein
VGWGDSWGSSASQSAIDVAAAFYEGRKLKRSSCETDGETYWYSKAPIARRIKPEDLPRAMERTLAGGKWVCRPLEFRFFYEDRATARHLKALGLDATYNGKHKGPRVNGNPIVTERWYTPAEIATLKPAPPPPPKPTKFVNLTLPLFA